MTCCTTPEPTVRDGTADAPFRLRKGKSFSLVVTAKSSTGASINLDSPNRTGRSQLRKTPGDIGPAVATFTVTKRDQTTQRGKADVTLGATVSAKGATSDILPGTYVMDVEFVNASDPDDVIGTDVIWIEVVQEVTA